MNKPIFNEKTKRGVMVSTQRRKCLEGEFTPVLTTQQLALFKINPPGYQFMNGVFSEYEEDAEQLVEEQKKIIAAERYRRETSDLEYEGMLFFMEREDRTTLEQTMDKIRRGVITESIFKCRNGWITLSASNIDAIELAGVQHVASAFIWEKNELDKLN